MKYATTMLLTACVFALGCAGGGGAEEQNYKVLEEDREMFRTDEDRPTSMQDARRAMLVHGGKSSADATPTAQPAAADQPDIADELLSPVSESADPAAGTILDRSNWSRITVRPADGGVRHNPVYWRDCPIDDTYVKVLAQPREIPKLEAALDNPYAANWNGTNALGTVAQPVKFAVDTVLLPLKFFTEGCPWSEEISPKK